MKISIWQQFSSNHSAHFILIGQFKTFEMASAAAAEVSAVLSVLSKDIRNRRRDQLGAKIDPHKYRGTQAFLDYLVERYGIVWQEPCLLLFQSPNPIRVFGDSVLLDMVSLGHGCEPFASLLRFLGAEVFERDEWEQDLTVRIICLAPDEATAENLMSSIEVTWQKDWHPSRHVIIGGWFHANHTEAIRREGNVVIFPLDYYWDGFDRLFEFDAYLRKIGCTEIQYQYQVAGRTIKE